MAEAMVGLKRSHRCTEVSADNVGQTVTVMGWVQTRRNLGALIFVDLRDRTGLLQIVFDENVNYSNNDELVIDTDGNTTTYYIAIASEINIPTATLKYNVGFSTPFTMTYYLDNGENLPEPTEIYYNIRCSISSVVPTWKNHYFTQWIDNETWQDTSSR